MAEIRDFLQPLVKDGEYFTPPTSNRYVNLNPWKLICSSYLHSIWNIQMNIKIYSYPPMNKWGKTKFTLKYWVMIKLQNNIMLCSVLELKVLIPQSHRLIILNRGSMLAFQWREFSPPLSSASVLLWTLVGVHVHALPHDNKFIDRKIIIVGLISHSATVLSLCLIGW